MQDLEKIYLDKIANNIKLLRLEYNLSQENLAEKIDCSREFINRIENKKEAVSLKMLLKLAILFGVNPSRFFE